jgi:hypothetical protein
LENVAQGIRQGRTIGTEDFYDLLLPLPSPVEQRAIAEFLDRETARIDALINKKRRLRTVMAERLRILTSEVMTGHCDVTSGKEFEAALPRPIGAFSEVQLGRQRTPKDDEGPHMVRYLRAANVKDGALALEDVKLMNFSPCHRRSGKLVGSWRVDHLARRDSWDRLLSEHPCSAPTSRRSDQTHLSLLVGSACLWIWLIRRRSDRSQYLSFGSRPSANCSREVALPEGSEGNRFLLR